MHTGSCYVWQLHVRDGLVIYGADICCYVQVHDLGFRRHITIVAGTWDSWPCIIEAVLLAVPRSHNVFIVHRCVIVSRCGHLFCVLQHVHGEVAKTDLCNPAAPNTTSKVSWATLTELAALTMYLSVQNTDCNPLALPTILVGEAFLADLEYLCISCYSVASSVGHHASM